MENSLNEIRLDDSMLAALYGRSLVHPGKENVSRKSSEEKTTNPFKFLGNNARKISVLVNNPENAFLPENQLAFLTKMLGACQMNTGDIAIVNLTSGITLNEVKTALSPRKIIDFGTQAGTELFKLINLEDVDFLSVPALDQLVAETEASKQLKSKLWGALKEMFGIE
jgi:hypothetical protein